MAVEYRGCRNLVYAEVTTDDNEVSGGYVTGDVKILAPVAEISKTVETSSESHYYDNIAAINVDSEGSDTVTFTIAIPTDEVLAEISGRVYDQTKKAIIEAPRKNKYFAVGYIIGEVGEGEEESYVWRYKGSFNIPDETSATKDNSTTANNMSLTFTGIYTTHNFTNGGGKGVKAPVKAMKVEPSATITESVFFGEVYTPDTTA
jgi:phi13 family phage major tail protein